MEWFAGLERLFGASQLRRSSYWKHQYVEHEGIRFAEPSAGFFVLVSH